ncbi:hypothetical protein CVT91_00165 [Candidatus Atribacteria bacterium HGW-Atribacteria-1]|nr:MAG: hypothetical protein CVT91_00165 [Candidatus Atribacteria bacterium HGW-Atribacteria-1]
MTPIAHLAVTSLARNNPIASLIWGSISHWILDETCSEYRPMKAPMIIYEAIITIGFLMYTKYWWCLLGLLPDFIEGIYIAIKGIEVWHSGELLFPFHKYKGQKIWSFRTTVIVEFMIIVMVLAVKEMM